VFLCFVSDDLTSFFFFLIDYTNQLLDGQQLPIEG